MEKQKNCCGCHGCWHFTGEGEHLWCLKHHPNSTHERIGIIRNPGYGNRDVGYPILFFDVYVEEALASLQCFNGEEANEILRDSGVYSVEKLDGMPCWVRKEPGSIKFLRMWRR